MDVTYPELEWSTLRIGWEPDWGLFSVNPGATCEKIIVCIYYNIIMVVCENG